MVNGQNKICFLSLSLSLSTYIYIKYWSTIRRNKSLDVCYNMGEPQKYSAKEKRPDAKDHMLDHIKDHIWFHLSEISRKSTPIKQMSGCLRLEMEMDSDHKWERGLFLE